MPSTIWLSILAPFAGALILAATRMPKKAAGVIGCASVGIAWIAVMITGVSFISGSGEPIRSVLYTWMNVGGLNITAGLHIDALSLVMSFIITFVGFLIHLYASQSMYDEDGYRRFFAYMNLFIGSMLTLVLADNLLLLYLGWEGVGLCSYLLIGFWYKDTANVLAAQKAFIVTRIGDTALAIGLFMLVKRFGTLDIAAISTAAPGILTAGAATIIAFLIIGGAIGKSAQVPLQTWLPDAMAGPTPVSALIHAATMVTAGVYLIARLHPIFILSREAMFAVAVIGTITLFYSAFSALVQRDIKRVLAYSTISQIGYMFLALGVGAWTVAMFHFFTHAFFKALLFLSAGVVIDAQRHEHDILKMGGLRTKLPIAYWTFLIGAASLSALPFVTAGFYSKDAILWADYSSPFGGIGFLIIALLGAFITSVYSFRVVYLVFFGEQKMEVTRRPGWLMSFALIVLAFFSIVAGFLSLPESIANFNPFGRFVATAFPGQPAAYSHNVIAENILIAISSIIAILGVYTAWLYFKNNRWARIVERSPALHAFFYSGWGFDWLYNLLFIRPFTAITTLNRKDAVDTIYTGLAGLTELANRTLTPTQTGRVRNYAAGIVLGAVIVAIIVLLR